MILVTGGTGLVGSHLLHFLLSRKEGVKAVYRSEESIEKTRSVFKAYDAEKLFDSILWVKADISDYFSLEDIFDNIDYVYHCAAVVSFDRKWADKMNEINIEGTEHLVNLSLQHQVKKFCFVSSVASLGEYADGKCADEDTLWAHTKTTSEYSTSKFYAESAVWRAAEEGLNVVIVNPATIIGYGSWEESSTAIIKKVATGLNYYTTGSNGFVGVTDVVKAMYLLMNSEVSSERFVLVSENWSFKKLLEQIALGLGKKPPQKEAPRGIANLLRRLDEARYFLFGSSTVLTKQTVATAYRQHCYSAEKIKNRFNFQFEPMESVIQKVTLLF